MKANWHRYICYADWNVNMWNKCMLWYVENFDNLRISWINKEHTYDKLKNSVKQLEYLNAKGTPGRCTVL